MWRVLALAFVVVVGAPPEEAEACSCSGPRAVTVPQETAATNSHVFVIIPEGNFSQTMSPFWLRVADTTTRIDVDEASTLMTGVRLVELTPRTPLSAKTTYEIIDAAKNVVGKLVVGDTAQAAPGAWKGIAKTEVLRYKHAGGGSCRSGAPFVRLALDPALSSNAVYLIWIVPKGRKIDYSKPPTTLDVARSNLELGNHHSCRLFSFPVPEGDAMRLGIVRVELSGARSAPTEADVDFNRAVAL